MSYRLDGRPARARDRLSRNADKQIPSRCSLSLWRRGIHDAADRRLVGFAELLRSHAPTLGTSFGTLLILMGSVLYFSLTEQRPAVHEVLIFVFVTVTTPVTLMLLARAALYRDRAEKSALVPPPLNDAEVEARSPRLEKSD